MEPKSYQNRREAVISKMRELLDINPNLGRRSLARMINEDGIYTTGWEVRKLLQSVFQKEGRVSQAPFVQSCQRGDEPIHTFEHDSPSPDRLVMSALKRGPVDIATLSEITNLNYAAVLLGISTLRAEGRDIEISNDAELLVSMRKTPEIGGSYVIDVAPLRSEPYTFGFVSDTHLCSKYQRLDALNAIYDIFEREGITDVYHGGNYIDGEASFNMHDLLVHGVEGQVDYFIDKYPQRSGITTHFIAGDDHEGWIAAKAGINIGKYTQMKAVEAGRDDLHYLGYMEADIALKAKDGRAMMRLAHPGGGSSYAFSYKSQKITESLQPGEKPQILLLGHLHKLDLCYPRGVWACQLGSFQDQTPFLRKKNIESHVGGGIASVRLTDSGSITSFRVEFIPFYDRGFYQKFDRF